jgi:hypothetical protein
LLNAGGFDWCFAASGSAGVTDHFRFRAGVLMLLPRFLSLLLCFVPLVFFSCNL